MKGSILPVFAIVAVVALQGCNIKFGRSVQPQLLPAVGQKSGQSGTKTTSTQAYGLKQIKGKQEPTSLIARDGTTCTTSKEKFDSAIIGRSVWCTWIDQRR